MSKPAPEQVHRREVRNRIMLPMVGAVVVLVGLLVALLLTLTGVQMGIVANCLLTVFILLPTVLICLIPTLIMVAGSVGLWKANAVVARPLRRGRTTAVGYLARAQEWVPRAAQPVTALQTRLSSFEYLIGRLTGVKPGLDGTPADEEQPHGREAQ